MKILKKLAPHVVILIGNMYYVFWGIDRVNKAMNFIDNGYTKFLLLVMILCCAVNVFSLLPQLLSKLGRTANPAPVFVRMGMLAVNALLAVIVLILLTIDLFNEDLMIFLRGFVKTLILLLSITGLLCSLQVTARDRAYIRAMNRRAAQRRQQGNPRPQPQAGYPSRASQSPAGYSARTSQRPAGYPARVPQRPAESYGRQSSYARRDNARPAQARTGREIAYRR